MRLDVLSNSALIQRCCGSDDAEVWEEFIRRTRRLVAGVVYRVASRWNETRPEILEELIQDTYLHLFSNDRQGLKKFQPQSEEAFFGYIKVIAANLTHDYLRAQNADKRGASLTDSADAANEDGICTVQIAVKSRVEEEVLVSEIESWLNKLVTGKDADKQKAIFWLFYRYQMTAASIAQIEALGLTTKGVEAVIHRLTQRLRDKLSPTERHGLATLAGSKGTGEA